MTIERRKITKLSNLRISAWRRKSDGCLGVGPVRIKGVDVPLNVTRRDQGAAWITATKARLNGELP